MAQENLAYDLSLFEPREPRQRKTLRVVHNRKKRVGVSTVLKSVTAGAFVVISLVAVMVLNVRLNETNSSVSAAQKRYTTAQSESVRLNMQLESRMSLKNVESYAVSTLGMQKIQASQIQYINLGDSDKVVVSETPSSPLSLVKRLLAYVEEYFK